MAFEEWLALGGNEIINNARTVGYARTAACPMGWFKTKPCDTLLAATLIGAFLEDDKPGDGDPEILYRQTAIEAAPWYDPVLPDVSRRFYGAFGLHVAGIEDSTRIAAVTQGLSDGGTIGRVRKGPREVRVVALLAGEGQDALEYGMSWLTAALDPNACGQHGDACGTADLAFFSTCPPPRKQVPVYAPPEVAGTNLILNPSMETPGGPVTLRTNLVLNPRMQTVTNWGGNAGTIAATNGGLLVEIPADIPAGTLLFNEGQPWSTVAPGETVAASMDIEVPDGYPAVTLSLHVEYRDGGGTSVGPAQTFAGGGRGRLLSAIAPAGAGTTVARILVYAAAALPAGSRFLARNALMEKESAHLPYFDGASEDVYETFTYAWTGAVDNSPSTQSALTVNHYSGSELRHAYQSAPPGGVAAVGDYAIRAVSHATNVGDVRIGGLPAFIPGGEYTISADLFLPFPYNQPDDSIGSRQRRITVFFDNGATESHSEQAPNEIGWHRIQHSFVAPPSGNVIIGLGSGGSPQDDYFTTYWDAVALVEGQTLPGYFDGDTPDTSTEVFEWTGTPHDSTSTATVEQYLGEAPEGTEDYRLSLNKVRRYLHDVGAVSGPLIQAEIQSGSHWAYQVEFTLVAANPYVYGVRREIALPPRLPVIVSDIPYNLIPYPSAEVAGESTVIVQTNYAPNPSAEVTADFWETWQSGFDTSVVTLDRSNELSAAGAYSATSFLEVKATVPAGFVGVRHSVPLPGITPATRYSVNVWGAALKRFGTGAMGDLTYLAQWMDGGGTILREDVLGTRPSASGGAVSVKAILPPPGTTQMKVAVKLDITGAVLDDLFNVYADAVAVTVP